MALCEALAAEVVTHEAKAMQESSQETTEEVHKLSIGFKCYRCGKQGHSAAECKHKKAKCHLRLKVGHLAQVCQAGGNKSTVQKDAGIIKHLNTPKSKVV